MVDDEPQIRRALRLVLRANGYDVTEALRETVRLQQKIVRPAPVELEQAPVAVAV